MKRIKFRQKMDVDKLRTNAGLLACGPFVAHSWPTHGPLMAGSLHAAHSRPVGQLWPIQGPLIAHSPLKAHSWAFRAHGTIIGHLWTIQEDMWAVNGLPMDRGP